MSDREIIEEHLVLAFLERFLEDCQQGSPRPVEHYCRLFPGADARLRAEYAQLLPGGWADGRTGAAAGGPG